MKKLKTGDIVIVLAGKDKGASGKILKVFPKKNKAVVEGINLVKKHMRGNPKNNEQGGIFDKEAPINMSNLGYKNPQTNRPDRIGFKILENGKKVRILKSNNEVIDT